MRVFILGFLERPIGYSEESQPGGKLEFRNGLQLDLNINVRGRAIVEGFQRLLIELQSLGQLCKSGINAFSLDVRDTTHISTYSGLPLMVS